MISTLVAGMLPAKESNSLSDAMSSGCSIAHRAPHPQLVNPCAIHASSKATETLGSPPTPEPALGGKGRREEREEGAWEVREGRGGRRERGPRIEEGVRVTRRGGWGAGREGPGAQGAGAQRREAEGRGERAPGGTRGVVGKGMGRGACSFGWRPKA